MKRIKNLVRLCIGIDRESINVRLLQIKYLSCRISKRSIITTSNLAWIRLGENVSISHLSVLVAEQQSINSPEPIISIGKNTYIGEMNNIRASSSTIFIGDNVLLSQNVSLISSNHSIDPSSDIRNQEWNFSKSGITIENDVWIGCNSVILPGVTLGHGCVIGAGSVVTKSVPAMSIAVGNPAKVIKSRI